jgi:cytochrome b subunit of formate dehydrogenase
LPANDPTSSVYRGNLKKTCGDCHKGITEALATAPIHQPAGKRWSGLARLIEVIYIFLIVAVIGAMLLYVMIDLLRHIRNVMGEKQVKRMEKTDVIQHIILAVSFTVLVVTGFALRHYDAWYSKLLFGFEGGYQLRGLIHRIAAIVLILGSFVHIGFLFTRRGRAFLGDMAPRLSDIKDAFGMLAYNLGGRPHPPRMGRFTFAEKVEYWALVWGTAIMAITGCVLWLKTSILFPKELLDICLVIHGYEAWLAFLAILVWHLYYTVFSPKVYPVNMAWLTGKVPERVFLEEHSAAVDNSGTAIATPSGGTEEDEINNA